MFKDNAAGKWTDCRYGQGAYGGLWTENIVQAVSRDLLAAAMMRLEAAGYRITLHVHDEIVAEAPIGFGGIEEFQHLITTLPDWAEGLPIAAKVRNGERFSKSEKLKADGAIDGAHGDALDDILDGSAEFAGYPDSGQPEITHQQPFVSVEPEANHNTAVENSENSGNSENSNDNGNEHDDHRADGTQDDRYDHSDRGQKQHTKNRDGYPHGEHNTGHQVAFFVYHHADGRPYLGVKKTSTKQFVQHPLDRLELGIRITEGSKNSLPAARADQGATRCLGPHLRRRKRRRHRGGSWFCCHHKPRRRAQRRLGARAECLVCRP